MRPTTLMTKSRKSATSMSWVRSYALSAKRCLTHGQRWRMALRIRRAPALQERSAGVRVETPRHEVHGPFGQQVAVLERLPARQPHLPAGVVANPGSGHLHLTAVEADLAHRPTPAIAATVRMTPVACPTMRLGVLPHHLG